MESKVLTNDEVVERIEHGDVQDLNYMFITTCVLTSAQQSHFVLNHCLTPFFHSDEAFSLIQLSDSVSVYSCQQFSNYTSSCPHVAVSVANSPCFCYLLACAFFSFYRFSFLQLSLYVQHIKHGGIISAQGFSRLYHPFWSGK